MIKYTAENNFFLFLGVSKCKQICVSWFWKFDNLTLKSFVNIIKGVCTKPCMVLHKYILQSGKVYFLLF